MTDEVPEVQGRIIRELEGIADGILHATPEQLADLVAWNDAVDRERVAEAEDAFSKEQRRYARQHRKKRLPATVRFVTLRKDER